MICRHKQHADPALFLLNMKSIDRLTPSHEQTLGSRPRLLLAPFGGTGRAGMGSTQKMSTARPSTPQLVLSYFSCWFTLVTQTAEREGG